MIRFVKSKWHWCFLALFVAGNASAQKEYRISVQDAVTLALKNTTELKNLRIDSLKQRAQNSEIAGSALPQVSGAAQIGHYLTLPKILFPDAGETGVYSVLNKEGVRDGNGNPIAPKQSFAVREFSFVQPWNLQAGVTLSQLLFQPDVFVALLARKTLVEFTGHNIRVAEDKVREQVYKAYYQVLIAEMQLEVLKKTLQRFEKLVADQQQLYKNGFIEKLDIDKSTVALNNLHATETQLKNMIELGYAALKFALGLSQSDTILLTDVLNENSIKDQLITDEQQVYNNRSEMKLLNTAQKLGKIDLKRYRLGYLPTLAFAYQFQQQGQMNKNFSAFTGKNWFWFNSNLIGLNLNVPLFDGMQRKYKIQQARYNLEKTNNSIEQFKRGVDLEVQLANINLRNALLNMESQSKNLALAEQVYQTTRKKYEQGLGNTFELLQTDSELQRAQGNYYEALYNAVLSRINYLKATGKLQ
jgi:outer membrane protein TolC